MAVIFTETWQGSTSDYNAAPNWDTSNVPDAANEAALFDSVGVTTVQLSSSIATSSWNFGAAAQSYIISGSPVTLNAGISNLANAGQLISISNNVGGSGGITQDGDSTLLLSGADAYLGATTVNAGTLRVDGSIANSATTVNSGGTLAGNGTMGSVDVASGGTLSPGASAGVLTTGNLSFAAGATFAVELGGTTPGVGGYDQIVVNGTVALNGATLSVSILGGFDPATGTEFIIIDNDGTDLTGIFAGLPEGAVVTAAPGNTYSISYSGSTGDGYVVLTARDDVAVNAAPELNAAAAPVLASENEDPGAPGVGSGTLISALVDLNPPSGGLDNVTDVDASPVTGIAVTGVNTANGTWLYSTDGGTNWNPVGAVTDDSARLLVADANTRLFFAPNANFNGTVSSAITFRAWDQSFGINGSLADPTPAGSITAFSTASDTADITVTAVNDAAVFTNLGGPHPSFTENGSSVVLDNDVTVSDTELNASLNKFAGATLTLARDGGANPDDAFAGAGSLDLVDSNALGENVSLDNGVTFVGTASNFGDGTFSITFNSNATAGVIASVMHQIAYADSSDNPPASVQIDWTFSDGNGQPGGQSQGTGATPGVATGSVTVDVTQVDAPPVLLNVAATAAYSLGSSGEALSLGLQVFDPDATPPSSNVGLANATVKIASGFFAGDELFVNLTTSGGFFRVDDGNGGFDTTNISVQSNVLGTLVLSGSDSVTHYQSVLDAVSYHSTAADPSNGGATPTRTISWQVNDGLLNSQTPNPDPNNLVNETILHFNAPPILDLDASGAGTGFTTTFSERGAPVAIVDIDVSIADPDNFGLASATIVLTNAKPDDALSIAGTLPGGIDSSIDTSVPGQIIVHLFNSASFADYQTALHQVRFANTSTVPNTTDRDITVTVNDGDADSNVAHATVHVINLPSGGTDFNADGLSDFLWQTDGGSLAIWEMNGFQISAADYTRLGSSQVGLPGPDWHIVDTGDFDGDGKADILWRTDSGAAAIWEMDGTHIKAADFIRNGSTVVGAPDPDWHQLGAADFDGDGKADILWRTDSGALAIWEMDGTHIKTADFIRNGSTAVGAPAPDWKIVGVGDFEGDGNNDLLWETGGGALAVWEMNGTHIKSADYIKIGSTPTGIPGADWHVADVGDFDGDGKADILWRVGAPAPASGFAPGGGPVAIWEMNGNQIKAADYTRNGSTAVGAPGTDWHLLGSDDYTGDGMNDILWRTDSGQIAIWDMDGTHILAADYTKISATNVGAPGADWHLFQHHYELL